MAKGKRILVTGAAGMVGRKFCERLARDGHLGGDAIAQLVMTDIVLPPSLKRIYPSLVSQCIIVMLGSSVVSQVSYEELTFAANLIQSRTFLSFEVYLVTTLFYLMLSVAMRQLLLLAGRRFFGSEN